MGQNLALNIKDVIVPCFDQSWFYWPLPRGHRSVPTLLGFSVIPTQAGIPWVYLNAFRFALASQGFLFGWIPAFAGMTS
jgi:hypothetical protein